MCLEIVVQSCINHCQYHIVDLASYRRQLLAGKILRRVIAYSDAGVIIAQHPAFGDFPHQGYLNQLWFRILDLAAHADGPKWPLARPPFALETSLPGVFAAGDVRLDSMKRVVSAVCEGAMAVYLIHRYLATI